MTKQPQRDMKELLAAAIAKAQAEMMARVYAEQHAIAQQRALELPGASVK